MVKNFRFVEPGTLALSGAPQSAEDVDWLYDQGIRTIVSLHPIPPEAQARLGERGIAWKAALTPDFAEGAPEGFAEALAFLAERSAEAPALLHCQGGGGRAGTGYAAYLISKGVPVEQAIAEAPGVERDTNKAFLRGFAAGRR